MKQNRATWVIGLGALIGIFLLIVGRKSFETQNTSNSQTSVSTVESAQSPPVTEAGSHEKAVRLVAGIFSAPIEFYGRVVDQKRQPVSGAEVGFQAADQFMAAGTRYSAKSDSEGFFSITGIRGAGLDVIVSKHGYDTLKGHSDQTFGYGMGPDSFRKVPPTKDKPAVFVLRKMSEAEPLIEIDPDIVIPKDGTPVEVSLRTGKLVAAGEGDMKFECWADDRNKDEKRHYEWHARISVPGGGMVVRKDKEFVFEAPEEGYAQSIELRMPQAAVPWSDGHDEQYWVKLANGTYARMRLRLTTAGGHFVSLTTFLNPSGSRNLEYDPRKKVPVH